MFKSLVIALLGVAILSVGSLEAQLFRRFAAPRGSAFQSAPQGYRTIPSGRYAVQPQASQAQTYYQRVQVAPGRFAVVPVQPNVTNQQQPSLVRRQSASAPQDIARQSTGQGSRPQANSPSTNSPSLDRARVNSVLTGRTQPAPVASSPVRQTQQRYRRVTVYNTRTGQRSTRLIPIPSSTLTQQPYVYGQPGVARSAPPKVVTGTLSPPAQPAQGVSLSNEIRLDSQVQQATFEEPSVVLELPKAASVMPVSPQSQPQPQPQPQPAIAAPASQPAAALDVAVGGADQTFSVLDFNDEVSDNSGDEILLELAAPVN